MALTQQQIELCSQEGKKAAQDCINTYRTRAYANIDRIRKTARDAREANWNAYRACQDQVPSGCPPTAEQNTEEHRNICEGCWKAYSKEEARIVSTEADLVAAEERLLQEKTNQRYDGLGNPLPGCECCDKGRAAEAACRRRGATPIAIPVNPTVPQPRPRDILDDAMEERDRKLYGPIPM